MSTQPNLLRKIDHSGVPLLLVRLVLGFVFIWMGMAKTGLPYFLVSSTGLGDSPAVQRVVEAGWIEMSRPVDFLVLIREYEMFPDSLWWLLNIVAVAMPWVEITCGILLIAGVAVRGSALLLFSLLVLFTTMIAWRGWRIYDLMQVPFCSIKFDCGCGAGEVYICHKLPENLALILLTLVTLISGARRFCMRKDLIPSRRGAGKAPEMSS